MEKINRNCVEDFVRSFDFFGESFTFKYKEEDNHSTFFGGLITIIFFFTAILYLIYSCIPFKNMENFTLIYYTMNLNITEQIDLSEEPTAFAIGLTDNNNNKNVKYNISDLLDLKIEFVTKIKEGNKKTKNMIDHHLCNNIDFHNLHKRAFDELNINNLNCLSRDELIKNRIEGIYTDEIFSYYEISVESKYKDNETHNKLINDYLVQYDCKLQFYYTDIAIDIENYKYPFSTFLNSLFLQLNPSLIQKKNIFFMNYHLYDDNQIFHIFESEEETTNRTGLSRVEDYFLYKGIDRAEKKLEDYSMYAKMYIRVDNKKIEINRRYQDLMEFYADASSLFLSVYYILVPILGSYDRTKATHSISKKLFYFEGTKNNKFPKFIKFKKIIDYNKNTEQNMNLNINLGKGDINSKNKIIVNNNPKEDTKSKFNNNKEETKKEEEINYSYYNLFEIIASSSFCCCKTKKFKKKLDLIEKANSLIDDKLDIVFYIRNMYLFEMINNIYLENKNIVNFLSRPIVYLNDNEEEDEEKKEKDSKNDMDIIEIESSFEKNEEEKNEVKVIKFTKDDLYKSAYRFKPDVLTKKIQQLFVNRQKTKVDKKLIYYLDKHLKNVQT